MPSLTHLRPLRAAAILLLFLTILLPTDLPGQGQDTIYIPKGGIGTRGVTLVNFGPGLQEFTVTASQDAVPGWDITIVERPGPPFIDVTDQLFGPGYLTGPIPELSPIRFGVTFDPGDADFGDRKVLTTTARNEGNAVVPFITVELTAVIMTGDLVLRDLQQTGPTPPNGPPADPPKIGDDVHTPSNPDVVVNAATRNGATLYRVEIENEGDEPASYILGVQEQGNPAWQVTYLIGTTDVSAGLRTDGVLFPNMAPGESREVLAILSPGPGVTVECDQFASIFILTQPTGEVMDAVVGVAEYFGEGLEASLETKSAGGANFNVELTVTNRSPRPATSIVPLIDLGASGELQFEYTGLATPASVATLDPGQTVKFTRPITVMGEGEATIVAAARGTIQKQSGKTATALSNIASADLTALPVIEVTTDPDRVFKKDEVFTAIVTVRHQGQGEKAYEFNEPWLKEVPSNTMMPREILMLAESETPEPFMLSEADPERTFRLSVLAEKRGSSDLESSVTVTDDQGAMTQETDAEEVIVSPFEIEVKVTPESLLLNQTAEEDFGQRARDFNAMRVAMGMEEIPNLIEIEMTVKNASDIDVENVNLPPPGTGTRDILSFITSQDLMNPHVPLTPVRLYPPEDGDPIDLMTPMGNPMVDDVTIEPGKSIVFAWLVQAFDVDPDPESDDSICMDFEALVVGSIEGTNVKDLGTEEIQVVDKPLLEWGIKPTDGRTNYTSGQTVRVDGYIENISARDNDSEGRDIVVMVYQVPEGNLGGGYMFKASQAGSATPSYYEIFTLPPMGDEKSLDLRAVFRTFPATEATEGKVKYGVRLWVKEDDDSLTEADGQEILKEGYVEEFDVKFSPNRPVFSLRQQCVNQLGISPFLCGLNEGLTQGFADGAIGLLKFLAKGGKELANLGPSIFAHEMWVMNEMWKAAWGDEAARAALVQEAYVQYRTFVELGVMAGEAGSQVPMAIEAFSTVMGDSFSNFFKAVEDGDLEELQFVTGKFLGENPDLILEPLIIARGYQRMARALEADINTDVVTKSRSLEKRRQSEGLTDRVRRAEADPNVSDTAKALLPGDKLSLPLLKRIYGIGEKELRQLQKIAADNGVILTFRSRSPISRVLLDSGQAWPKPQALKFKTVSKIDIDYLGYRGRSKGTLEIVEPPSGLKAIVDPPANVKDPAVKRALSMELDRYMEGLRANKPELRDNPVLFNEVRERLRTRAKEWNKLVPELKLKSNGPSDIDIGTNFGTRDQVQAGKAYDRLPEIAANDTRKVTTTPVNGNLDPVTGAPRKTWELRMEGPNGAAQKAVTGDVDFLAILEPGGGFIDDVERRLKIYSQLAQGPISMQHGESFTFIMQNARAEFLRCCTVGGEAMVTISPFGNQTPTAGYFVDGLSIMKNNRNSSFFRPQPRARRTVTDETGKVIDESIFDARRPDPTGEMVLIAGADVTSKIDLNFVRRFRIDIIEKTFDDFLSLRHLFLPGIIGRIIFGDDTMEGELSRDPSAPTLQVNDEAGVRTFQVWEEGSGWRVVSVSEAISLGGASVVDMAPNSTLTLGTSPGDTGAEIVPADQIVPPPAPAPGGGPAPGAAPIPFFEVGDRVVINPGGANEEFATVNGIDPLTFAAPLRQSHAVGELIVSLGPDTTDRDGDGVDGFTEVQDGTNPDLADTDGDGIDDGTEKAQGSDPLTPSTSGSIQSVRADFSNPADREVQLVLNGIPGQNYLLQGSPDLTPGSWTTLRSYAALPFSSISDSIPDPSPATAKHFFRFQSELSNDPDHDNLSDYEEEIYGTDPNHFDTDRDGMGDGTEIAMGTDPLDSTSLFRNLQLVPLPDREGSIIQFSTVVGQDYAIDMSTDLLLWKHFRTITAIDRETGIIVPSDPSSPDRLFVRARWLPPAAN